MTECDEARSKVRAAYASIATSGEACGVGCGPTNDGRLALGYTATDAADAPVEADLGLGCGNPHAIASLSAGETVIDLGCGAGFDCLLAAKRVGSNGHVIGVDMTAEMLAKARANAQRLHAMNVEFRLGEIEHLPCADACADVILSNCVINLSPDKAAVFREAFRVLKPGGRVAIADIALTQAIPAELQSRFAACSDCLRYALTLEQTRQLLADVGFTNVRTEPHPESRAFITQCMPGAEDYVISAAVEARKPNTRAP
jgi:SAM-dependent methyltransferase